MAAGATCTIAVDVTSAVAERYPNDTESVTSSLGTSTVAEATLTVDAVDALGFAKAFSPDTIDPGEVSTLTFTIDNAANLIDVGGLAFTDAFPDGLAVAGTPNAATTCGGSFAPPRRRPRSPSPAAASSPGKAARFPLTWWRRGPAR